MGSLEPSAAPIPICALRFGNIREAFAADGNIAAAPRYELLGPYMGVHPDQRGNISSHPIHILQASVFEKIDSEGCRIIWKLDSGILSEDFASLDALQVGGHDDNFVHCSTRVAIRQSLHILHYRVRTMLSI